MHIEGTMRILLEYSPSNGTLFLATTLNLNLGYRGEYSGYAKSWRNGYLCNFAGTISTLSSEVSLFFKALITLDRYIVVKFPFGNFRIDKPCFSST